MTSPSTPRHKSLFSCTSQTGILITPPSASTSNLFSITRPFSENSTNYTESEAGTEVGQTSPTKAAGLRKSPSWKLFDKSPIKKKQVDVSNAGTVQNSPIKRRGSFKDKAKGLFGVGSPSVGGDTFVMMHNTVTKESPLPTTTPQGTPTPSQFQLPEPEERNPSPTPMPQPSTPIPQNRTYLDPAFGSLRKGILKGLDTPGSGRSVRFGSRNAYRTITPTSPNSTFSSTLTFHPALEEPTPTEGVEKDLAAVGKGRPSVTKKREESISSTSNLEEKLKGFYLANKMHSEGPSESMNQETVDWEYHRREHDEEEYTDFLIGSRRMSSVLPEKTESICNLEEEELERRTVQMVHIRREEKLRDETTVLGMLEGSKTSVVEEQPSEKESPVKKTPSPSKHNVSTARVTSTSKRSCSSQRNVSVASDRGSFDVLSHYADEPEQSLVQNPALPIMADSPNLSRWSPDTTEDDAARSRSVSSASANRVVSLSRTAEESVVESDRSVGTMIIHEDPEEVYEEGSISMNDGTEYKEMRTEKTIDKSFSMRMPGKYRKSIRLEETPDERESQDELSALPMTPARATTADRTVFWTPGSAFEDLSLSNMSTGSPRSLSSRAMTKSIAALGHALIDAEDELVAELKDDAQKWKRLAEEVQKKRELNETAEEDKVEWQKELLAMKAQLGKSEEGRREAEIMRETMQRHYEETKEREARWQEKYELLKGSWDEQKQEKDDLVSRMRDEEIKRAGNDETEPLYREIDRLQTERSADIQEMERLRDELGRVSITRQNEGTTDDGNKTGSEMKKLRAENSSLRKRKEELNAHRLDLERAVEGLEVELDTVQHQCDESRSQERLVTSQMDEMKIALEKATETNSSLSSERDDMAGSLALKEDTIKSMQEELAAALRHHETVANERNAAMNERLQAIEQHTIAVSERDAALTRIEDMARNFDTLLKDKEDATQMKEEAMREKEEAMTELEATRMKLAEQEEASSVALAAAQAESGQLRHNDSEYARIIEELEAQLDTLEEEVTRTKSEESASRTALAKIQFELTTERDSYEQQLTSARERFSVLEREYDLVEGKASSLANQLDNAQRELERVSSVGSHNEAIVDELRSNVESLTNEMEKMKKERSQMRQESSTKDTQIDRLQRVKQQLRDDKELLNIALDSKQHEVELLKRKLGDGRMTSAQSMNQLGESMAATPGPSRQVAQSRRRDTVQRRASSTLATPMPNHRTLGRGTPSTMQATPRLPSVPRSEISDALAPSTKYNRTVSTSRSVSAQGSRRLSSMSSIRKMTSMTDEEYEALSLAPARRVAA